MRGHEIEHAGDNPVVIAKDKIPKGIVQGIEVLRRGAASREIPAHKKGIVRVLDAPGDKAADGNVNRCAILYTHFPRGIVKHKAVVVGVIGERCAVADVFVVAKQVNATVVGFEQGANVPPLAADVDKHSPVSTTEGAFAILHNGERV